LPRHDRHAVAEFPVVALRRAIVRCYSWDEVVDIKLGAEGKSMRIKAAFAGLLAGAGLASSFASVDALACGESLFRIGKGSTYRAQTAPLPGNVLVVAASADGRALAEGLAAAGHDVRVIESADAVAQELRARDYDIVLALFSDREAVETQESGSESRATFLPVTVAAEEATVAKQMYRRYLSADDSLKQFLRTIHRALREQRAS
jgi:hypothetical protein